MVAIAGAVAIGFSAVAADWFNGGVAAGWPTAGAGLTGGAWDDDAADKGAWDSTKGEEGAVAVDAEASDPLKFTADDAKTIGETAKTVTISSTIKFTPFETLPAVPENAKAGVIVVKDPDDPTIFLYYVLAKDPNGTTNIWEDAGVGPDDELLANITVTIAADGAAVYNLDGAKYNTTIATDGTISAANYTGDGEIASLSATYELNVVTLKLPADPANVGSVIVSNVTDGVAVEKKDGVYTFPYGANAQVWIYAKEGYLFANGENFKKYDETMTENKDYSSETPENPTEAEAKIGTQYYLTLAEALNAADGNTVTLLKDAAVDALTFNKSFTFDVDGKIATFNGAVQVAAGTVALKNSKSKAPEMGTSEGGIVVNAPISVAADATLDLSLMPFGKDVYGGIDASIPAAYLDLASGSTAKFYYWGLATKEEVDTPNWMYGNLPYFFKNGAIPTGAIVVINGTEWTGDAEKGRFVIAGEIAIATVQGEHQIGEPVPTTFTFTESFATVADAFALTVADGTVTMVENSTEDGAAIGTSCALELNGKQFTVNGAIAVANGATVTLKNNTFDPSNPLAGGQGGFAPNGVITVADGATIDLSSLPFGTTYGGVQGTGSLTLASGATAKFYKWNVPMVDSANWMFYNYPAFFTGSQIPVGGIVWIGETKWTGTADHFALDNEVATATVKANHNVGGDMSEFYHVESFADLAAAITANVKDDVKLYAATELAAVTKAVSIDLNGSDLSLTGDTLANDLTVKGAAGKLIASGTKAVNANLDLGELDYATQLAGNTGAFAIAAGKTVTLPVAQAAWQLPAAMFAGTADGAKLVTQASSYTYGNGVWTEGEEIAVAKIGNVGYATLDAAVEAAKAGDTVTLVANITTDATAAFKINKNLTLDFADYTVTKTVANDWTFDIANGATVVFDGNEGGVTQTQTAKNKDWPASMIRNKGNLTIKGGVYTSDFCIIKNDEDPGAGVLTVDGGTFNIVPAAEGMDDVQMALMNWATATINGGTWNGGVIASRSCDRNNVSKAGVTEIMAELDGTVKYMLMVGYPNDTTYANVPKMKGVESEEIKLEQTATITDQLTLVTDANDYVTVAQQPTVKVADIAAPEGLDAAFAYTTNCAPNALFLGWDVNYVVTFDADVKAGSLKLAGRYTLPPPAQSYDWTDYPLTEDLDAGDEWTLLPEGTVHYQNLYAMQEFDCGVANISAPAGTKMTVVLKMYNKATDEEFVLNTKEYTLAATKEAKIGTTYYLTLNAALEAAKAGDTVELCKDITTDATAAFKINKDITLDFGDYTVTKTVANDWTFDIANGATVVFDGNEGGVTQTQTAKNKDWPASMIRNKGNLTIKGGVYTSDFCIIKNDEDPGAGVLTVDGGTFNIVPAAEGMDDVQMALMNWATATINGGTWNGGVIASRSCDGNKVSKAGATEITAELDGTVKYMLMVGYPNDTTYANVPKMKGVDIKDVELTKVSTITDELELVEDGDWVTVQKKQSGPYTPETGGGTVEPTEIPGVYEVTPDPSSGIVTITGGLSETDTIIVTITNDFTIVGVPEDQIEIILNDIVVPNTAFVGGDENGFSTALNPDGDVDDVPVKPTLIEETEEEKPFVVGDSVETTVQAIPGLTYKLMRGDEPGAYPTQADKQSAGEGAATITLTDADKPADKAFYVIQVEK